MICSSCGTKNNYYHRYCYYCGNKLPYQPESTEFEDADKTEMAWDGMDDILFSSEQESELDYREQIPLRR